jgi:hypothetical protein
MRGFFIKNPVKLNFDQTVLFFDSIEITKDALFI